jgi:glycosyltransferase involved in cell wall biosynthesis
MRIGFDAKRAFLNSSGLGNYSRNTINSLNKYASNNQFVLYTPEIKNKLFENYRQFEVHAPDNQLSKIFSSVWRNYSSALFKKHKIDLFHGLSNELPSGIHKTNIPSVVTIHDLIFLRFPEFYKAIDRKIYYNKVKYACSSANQIIAISEQTKEDIIRFFSVDSKKIKVVYQSVSPVFFDRYDQNQLRSKFNLQKQFILSVGTNEPRKNQLSLLKAVHSANINIQIIFVGKATSYTKKMIDYIRKNKLQKQVTLLHNLSEHEVAGLYQAASISVYNSFFEGFGLPVIEAMASGCPVITSNVSCMPETAGGAALLTSPNDTDELANQIKLLLENDKLRNDFIQKGLERASHFHPEQFAKKMISLYTKLIL